MESDPFPPAVVRNRRLVNPGRIPTSSQCATHTLICNGSFEPSQKALLQHQAFLLSGQAGIEPATYGLTVRHSAN